MIEPLVYEVDGPVYLERQARARALMEQLTTPGATLHVEEWAAAMAAIQREVEPVPFVVGARYRIRALGAPPTWEHRHYRDEASGAIVGLDLPVAAHPEFMELDVVFRGRRPSAVPGAPAMPIFDMHGELALLADMDVLRAEEIR